MSGLIYDYRMDNIIINGDDFGRDQPATDGITEAFRLGYITQTTIMVNMPDCERAVALAKENGFFDKVGLHINLTQGYPLSEQFRKTETLTEDGKFSKVKIFKKTRGWGQSLTQEEKNSISAEIKCQIDRYKSFGFPLMHVDSHHHILHEMQIYTLFVPLASDFYSIRLGRNMMPHTIMNKVKLVYKYFLNRRIRHDFKSTTDYFGDYFDFKRDYKGKGCVEVMVHPELRDGTLFDIIYRCPYRMIEYDFVV